MNDPNTVPFIMVITIEHPPWITVVGRFDQAEAETKVRYVVTCDQARAAEVYGDAKVFARRHQGTISALDIESSASKFKITVPIVPEPGELKLISQAGTFFLAHALRLFWILVRLLQDRRADDQPFIMNLTLDHPPYFTITSQYVRDEHDMDVQHFLACAHGQAKQMYIDADNWKSYFHGSISHLDTTGSRSVFSVTIPIFNQDGELDTHIVQPGAFFLANAEILFRWLAGPLEKRRVQVMLRKKYGPKSGPKE